MNEEMNNSYYGNNTQGNPNPVPQPEPGKPSGYSIASMVLGICSIVTCCLYGVPGIICGIIACIFAKKEKRSGSCQQFYEGGYDLWYYRYYFECIDVDLFSCSSDDYWCINPNDV